MKGEHKDAVCTVLASLFDYCLADFAAKARQSARERADSFVEVVGSLMVSAVLCTCRFSFNCLLGRISVLLFERFFCLWEQLVKC